MSVRMKVMVLVQDKDLGENGPIQGARVTLWWMQEPPGEPSSFRRERVTDSQGLAVFLVPPGKYLAQVNAPEYKSEIKDPTGLGETRPYLVVDTMSAGRLYPVVANMTRDE